MIFRQRASAGHDHRRPHPPRCASGLMLARIQARTANFGGPAGHAPFPVPRVMSVITAQSIFACRQRGRRSGGRSSATCWGFGRRGDLVVTAGRADQPGSSSRALLGSSRDRVWLPFITPLLGCILSANRQSLIVNRQFQILPRFLVTRNPGRNRSPSIVVAAHDTESRTFQGVEHPRPQDVGHYFDSARKWSSAGRTFGIFAVASWHLRTHVGR